MDKVVVVKVVPDVVPLEFTVVVIRVHLFCHSLVKRRVEVAEEVASLFGSQIEHEDQPAHVQHDKSHAKTINSLHEWTQSVLWVGL